MSDSSINRTSSSEEPEMKALFQNDEKDSSFVEGFKDRVREVHEQFDKDCDGYLSFSELAALQLTTEGAKLTEESYVMACKALDCHPSRGISLDALRLTYAAQGTSIGKFGSEAFRITVSFVRLCSTSSFFFCSSSTEKDYFKVLPERKKAKVEKRGDDHVYEVGADGVDISD